MHPLGLRNNRAAMFAAAAKLKPLKAELHFAVGDQTAFGRVEELGCFAAKVSGSWMPITKLLQEGGAEHV